MNLEALKHILNSEDSNEGKESAIIQTLSMDENVIPLIMEVLEGERKRKKKMSEDMNVLLSKAHCGLEEPNINKDGYMQKEIVDFYIKYKDFVGHCFKNLHIKNWISKAKIYIPYFLGAVTFFFIRYPISIPRSEFPLRSDV